MKQATAYGLLFLIICFLSLDSFGQSPFYKPRKHTWSEEHPMRSVMAEKYSTADVVILDEYNGIRVHKTNPLLMSIVFEKKARIRYNSVDGVAKYSRFVLPESLDPKYDQQEVPVQERKTKIRPQYFDVEVDYFAARMIRKDGSIVEAIVEDSVAMDRLKFGIKIHDTWSFVFDVSGMEPGDELEVHYKYVIPYNENWFRFNRNRVFFHGNVPKQKFKLEFRADTRQDLAVLNTPSHRQIKEKDLVTHIWEYEDLPGCMDEVNARPYLDLPHLIYGLSQSDLRYRYRHNLSYEFLDIPYWTYIIKLREARALWLRRVAKKNFPDRQNLKVKEFMTSIVGPKAKGPTWVKGSEDLIDKAEKIHEFIATEFDFTDDDTWYDDRHGGLQKMGDHVEKEQLRELSRYDLYAKLLSNLGLNYYTAYVFDKRTGAINDEFLSPIWDNEWFFVLFDKNEPVFLHPKREDFGDLSNEIPFYWEGSSALLAQVDMLWSDFEKIPEFIDLPATDALSNFRNTNARVGVNLNKNRMSFDAKLTLSGQFETMTASAYEFADVDSTISPEYADCIYGLNGSVNVLEDEVTYITEDPPFRQHRRLKYIVKGTIEESENEWQLDLGGILNYIAENDYDAGNRDLPFYWDFLFLDNFNYQLVFDRNIELLMSSSANRNMNLSFGDLMFRCEQTAPNTIMISSFVQVKQERIEGKRSEDLGAYLDAINALSDLRITIRETGRNDP